MAYEVIVTSANKTVATMDAVATLVGKIQTAFGVETRIEVFEVKATYDGKTAAAKEVGTMRNLVATYPAA
jgi:hypothetical protein